MRPRTLLTLAVAAALALGAMPAQAKPKPITKKYTVDAPVPFPAPPTGPACSQSPSPVSEHRETFKATAAGTLAVVASGFVGDWDIGLFGANDAVLASGGGVDSPSTNAGTEKETLKFKIKKPQTVYLDVCNFAGAGTAKVTYTFTFA